ncbi:MAG: hypothetical protein ACM3OA_08375 [Acidobacteriota bacterium]
MDFGGNSDRRAGGQAADGSSQPCVPEGMARWRWLLFAIMARFEADEGSYLRIASALQNLAPRVDPRSAGQRR